MAGTLEPVSPSLLDGLNIRHEINVPLGPKTWYGVGGPAAILAHPASVAQLSALARRCHERGVPTRVLGSGANLLVADEGVDGVVVQFDDPAFQQVRREGNIVTAGAGADLMKLVLDTARQGLSGLEALAGIPASVGGAVRMNAGGAHGDIGRCIQRIEVMSEAGQVYSRDRDDLIFSYRKTNIVAAFILEVAFELHPDPPDSPDSPEDAANLMKRVKEIFLYKKTTQPMGEPSAGCAFKNPMRQASDDPENDPVPGSGLSGGTLPGGTLSGGTLSGAKLPGGAFPGGALPGAGQLIDMAGLKGHRMGGAEVSRKHANFIFTHPGATARDVLALLDHVQQVVQEKHGITLEREVVVWGKGGR